MTRFCPTCGTEVDETAVFCPSCGSPLDPIPDVDPDATMTVAPDPDEVPAVAAAPAAPAARPGRTTETAAGVSRAGSRRSGPPPAAERQRDARPQVSVPLTWPVTLSGWLIGVGAAMAAVGALVGFFERTFNPVDVLLLPSLAAVAASVFFSRSVPAVANLRLVTLAIVLVGFGVGLDRIGFRVAGFGGLLLFLGTASASIGALLAELGYDQPLGGPGA